MQLSKFSPQNPPEYIKQKISDLIMMQRYRQFTISKPTPLNNSLVMMPESTCINFEKSVKLKNVSKHKQIKTKIIRKIKAEQINQQMQKKAQKLLNVHLLFRLNQSVLQQVQKKVPLPLSVLDTKQQGDYLPDNQKKQYPHFSNIIKPAEVPSLMKKSEKILFSRPKPKQNRQSFSIQQIIKFKVKQILKFPKLLIRYGNQQFIKTAEQLLVSESNAKILYDFFNDYFDIQQKLDSKGEDNRKKYLLKIKKQIKQAVDKHRSKQFQSAYLPAQELFLNLKDLRLLLNESRQEDSSSESVL